MLNGKFTICFKITIKRNLTKSHASRLRSAKYKTHVIKERLLNLISYNKMNQSYGLSLDKTYFLSYEKVRWLSIKVTLKLLLLVGRMEKPSKLGE